ncbi:hypothetical protein OG879_15835 [Streptomyces caniferus]|nr:hypothetical protein [Streptomyces caniferus]
MERIMIGILGLVILLAAAVVGVAGVLTNGGSEHELTGGFSVFGYGMTGSTGMLFLYGIVVGAAALLGLALLFTGARHHTSRHGSTKRHGLKQSHHAAAAADNERRDLTGQRGTGRAETATVRGADSPRSDRPVEPHGGHRRRLHWFGHRAAHR